MKMCHIFFAIVIFLLIVSPAEAGTWNSLNDSTVLQEYCSSAPSWKLNLCNVTCKGCSNTNNYQCQTCDDNYTLTSHGCTLNNNTYYYFYSKYLTNLTIKQTQLNIFSSQISYTTLFLESTIKICAENLYNFEMVGLFPSAEKISFPIEFSQQMSSITLKFNLIVLLNRSKLEISLSGDNDYKQYSLDFSTISDLSGSYYRSKVYDQSSYLYLPSLNTDNARNIIQLIQNTFDITSTIFAISISVNNPSPQPFWGFSDIVILTRQCSTCPTNKLTSTISQIGKLTLYILAICVPLIIILILLSQIENYRRTKRLNEKVAGHDSDVKIPIKVIDRILSYFKFTAKYQSKPIRHMESMKNIERKTTKFN